MTAALAASRRVLSQATPMIRPSPAIVISVLLHVAATAPIALMDGPAVHVQPVDSAPIEVGFVTEPAPEPEIAAEPEAKAFPPGPPSSPSVPEPVTEAPMPVGSPALIKAAPKPPRAAAPSRPTNPLSAKARATDAEEAAYVPPRGDPSYLRNTPPFYPAVARRRGIEGTVMLRVHVGADGRPTDVLIRESSGFSPLDFAAVEAVRLWRFEPARRNGRPIGAEVEIPIRFRLADALSSSRRAPGGNGRPRP